jgi:hypothetical protein
MLYVLFTGGAGAPRNRRRVAPHMRSEGAKMAELHYMEMGWSGSGWMDPLPMENTPPAPTPRPSSFDDFNEPAATRTTPARPRRKAAKKSSARKSAKRARGRSSKKSAKKGAKKAARRGARKTARKSAKKSARGSARKSGRKSAKRGKSSSRRRAKKGGRRR